MKRLHPSLTPFFVLAFLVQTLLPFFAVYDMPTDANAARMASLYGDKVILCTRDGFELVSWQEAVDQGETPAPHPQYKCALCYVAAQGQALKPPTVTLAMANWPAVAAPVVWESGTRSHRHSQPFESRAPPAFAQA